ncbi:hypothetical protein KEM55_008327, partial [Ascosphaera atra]
MPYRALRQQFWRVMLKQYDTDELQGRVSKVELIAMLDTLGSTLKESTIDGFFERFREVNEKEAGSSDLSFDQAVMCLEDTLQNLQKKTVSKQAMHVAQGKRAGRRRSKAAKNGESGGAAAAGSGGSKRRGLRRRLTGSKGNTSSSASSLKSQQLQPPTPASEPLQGLSRRNTVNSVNYSPQQEGTAAFDSPHAGAAAAGNTGTTNENAVPEVVLSKSASPSQTSLSSYGTTSSVRSRLRSLSLSTRQRRGRERSKSASDIQVLSPSSSTLAPPASQSHVAGTGSGDLSPIQQSEASSPADRPPAPIMANLTPDLAASLPDDQKSIASTPSVTAGFRPDDLADIENQVRAREHDALAPTGQEPEQEIPHDEVEEHVVEIRE